MAAMDSARRQRYLKLMGIDGWRLRGDARPSPPPLAATLDVEAGPADGSDAPASENKVAGSPALARRTAAASRSPQPAAEVVVARPAVEPPGDWTGLRAMVRECQACKLCSTRTNTVFGVGAQDAPLMVIGEGPGADEDARGEPFVGRAGQLLDEMLKAVGRSRLQSRPGEAVFIANVVKCRPPGNRDPEAAEVEACRPYLDRQIELLRPALIVALGRVAAQRLLDTDAPLSRLRGPLHHYGPAQTPLLITYHPAYLLRSPREKAKSWQDLKRIHQFLQRGA